MQVQVRGMRMTTTLLPCFRPNRATAMVRMDAIHPRAPRGTVSTALERLGDPQIRLQWMVICLRALRTRDPLIARPIRLQIRILRPRKPLVHALRPRRTRPMSAQRNAQARTSEEEQVRRSTRGRRTPLRDNDDCFSRTSYTSSRRSNRSATVEEVEDEDAPHAQPSAAPDASGSGTATSDHAAASVGAESARTAMILEDPLTYEDAMASPDADEWRAACAIELEQFVAAETFHTRRTARESPCHWQPMGIQAQVWPGRHGPSLQGASRGPGIFPGRRCRLQCGRDVLARNQLLHNLYAPRSRRSTRMESASV